MALPHMGKIPMPRNALRRHYHPGLGYTKTQPNYVTGLPLVFHSTQKISSRQPSKCGRQVAHASDRQPLGDLMRAALYAGRHGNPHPNRDGPTAVRMASKSL